MKMYRVIAFELNFDQFNEILINPDFQPPFPYFTIARYNETFWRCFDSNIKFRDYIVWYQNYRKVGIIEAEAVFDTFFGISVDVFIYYYQNNPSQLFACMLEYLGMGTRLSDNTFVILG